MMVALASIRERLLTCCLGLIVNVTYPCPSVPLLGGRKPTLGSTGGSPAQNEVNWYDIGYVVVMPSL